MARRIGVRIRESDMPIEEQWNIFFEPKAVLEQLGLNKKIRNVADLGAGYGTFTMPAAEMISGKIYSLDIELTMVEIVEKKAKEHDLNNVVSILRDFISEGSGLSDSSVDFVMLFNILHLEKLTELLKEAYRILKKGGKAGIIHWNCDPKTPRGPMDIRPKPEQIRNWAESVGFLFERQLDLKPYHYAIIKQETLLVEIISKLFQAIIKPTDPHNRLGDFIWKETIIKSSLQQLSP